MNHGYMLRLPQRSPHQTVENHKKEVIYINVTGDIVCSVCCRHNIVLISI